MERLGRERATLTAEVEGLGARLAQALRRLGAALQQPGAAAGSDRLALGKVPQGIAWVSAACRCDLPPRGGVDGVGLDRGGSSDRASVGVAVPAGVAKIVDGAFQHCGGIVAVSIPEGATEIGRRAFDGCGGLVEVRLPGSVVAIGKAAFRNCAVLVSVGPGGCCRTASAR